MTERHPHRLVAFAFASRRVDCRPTVSGQSPAAVSVCGGRTDAAPVWRPAESADHATREFASTSQIAFPPTVKTVALELWGAGGGGGGGSAETYSEGGAGGGGGASGAYGRTVISITPGTVYRLVVGRGGPGGAGAGKSPSGSPGEDGGVTALCAGNSVVAFVPGGRGGEAARSNDRGGAGGPVVLIDAGVAIYRPGNSGMAGGMPLFEYRGWGGNGGTPVNGTAAPQGASGGNGGAGAMRPEPATAGLSGRDGDAILSW